jgi:plastocyanin
MNKTILIVILVLVVAAGSGIYYYSKIYPAPAQNAMPTQNQILQNETTTPSQKLVGSNFIEIQNFAFNPATVTIKVGDRLIWTNNDSAQHQIKSDTFNSDPLSKGQTFSFTFKTAGTYDYSCAIHPSMKGQIIVQ